MNDDALRTAWTSNKPAHEEAIMTAVSAVLEEDRAGHEKERWVQLGGLIALGLLCPALLWFAAFGWTHRRWSRQALPGPSDTRSQLQKTVWLLSRQATQLRSAALWVAPVFVGAALIGAWVYQERSRAGGSLLLTGFGAGWVVISVVNFLKARTLDERRARMEQLLSDLHADTP
jgi:hypothetical protein